MGKFITEMSLNSDIWMGDQFDTREEAIEQGMKLAKEEELKQFRIGETVEVHIPGVDAELVLERIGEMVYEEVGECAEDYLDNVEDSHLSELEESLNVVFFEWLEKHKYNGSYYRIKNEEIILCGEEKEIKFYDFSEFPYFAIIMAKDSEKALEGYIKIVFDPEDDYEIAQEPKVISKQEVFERYKKAEIDGCKTIEEKSIEFCKNVNEFEKSIEPYELLLIDGSIV